MCEMMKKKICFVKWVVNEAGGGLKVAVNLANELQEKYDELSKEKEYQENLSKRLKDDDYAAKYARAKYFYAKEGETIYNIPDLLPQ